MSPEERKLRSEHILSERGFPVNPELPLVEAESDISLRPLDEIGPRLFCLFFLVATAFEPDEKAFARYLREHDFWPDLTPRELEFFKAPAADEQFRADASWRIEALNTLLWASRVVEDLPPPSATCTLDELAPLFPTSTEPPEKLLDRLSLRPVSEILDLCDLTYRMHWALKEVMLRGDDLDLPADAGIVHQRHHALNWLVRYEDEDWDEVSCDT
ncbi:MAG: DUF4272 domain-containing protein [Pseudomonadota bacterium]